MAKLKKCIAVVLSLAICFSTCIFSGIVASAEDAEPINVVYSDDFSANSLSDEWALMANGVAYNGYTYTSEIENGSLKVNTNKQDVSYLPGCLYLPGKETVNQRVSVETANSVGDSFYVFARLNKPNSSNWKSLTGYYVRYCKKDGRLSLFKINSTSDNHLLIDCGYRKDDNDSKYRIDLTVTGTNPTVITVKMFKHNGTNWIVLFQNTYVDTDSPFTSGTAGIGASGTSLSEKDYTYLDNFQYTSTDNVKNTTPKYLSHLRTGNYKTFGQVVSLEKDVEYVFAAYGTVDKKDNNGYLNEPLWVEYQTGTFSNVNGYKIHDNRKSIQKTADLTKAQCEQNKLEYSEYNVSYVTFTAGVGETEPYLETNAGNRIRHVVGIRLCPEQKYVGNYSYFTLYRKDDPKRTNLLVNPDFKMGLYGWSDACGLWASVLEEETSSVSSKNSYVTLLSDKNNYEYYEMFKNPAYKGVDGDANRDGEFNVCDLVYSDLKGNNYYYLADYNKDGKINSSDGNVIKFKLASVIKEPEPEVFGLDNDSVDDDDFR